MEGTVVCPVCTLYLRPGMTLQSHLESHPKQKVIEALVKLHSEPPKEVAYSSLNTNVVQASQELPTQQQSWIPPTATVPSAPNGSYPGPSSGPLLPSHPVPSTQSNSTGPVIATQAGNHSFFYQQFMSSSVPQPSYVNQQYVIPMFNQPLQNPLIPGYMYQQQQMFVTSGPTMPSIMPMSTEQAPNIVEIHDDDEKNTPEFPDSPKSVILPNQEEEEDELASNERPMPELESQVEQSHISTSREEEDQQIESDKSCQTLGDDPPQLQPEVSDAMEKYDVKDNEIETSPNFITLTNHSNQVEDIVGDEAHHTFDMDGMNLILVHDFMQPSQQKPELVEPSAAEDYDYNSNASGYKYERPRILMNIGDGDDDNRDENISIDSVNIRADENMPPRGELSGQESNASDVASWSRLQYHESSSRMSTGMSTYDLLARESWEGSDASDVDGPPPYQSRDPLYEEDDDFPVYISGSSMQGIVYKCNTCTMTFMCPKERRVHQTCIHGAPASSADSPSTRDQSQGTSFQSPASDDLASQKKCNVIGSQLFKKKVKKLVIKPKPTLKETLKTETIESPFDHIFNNMMKVEDDQGTANQTKTEGSKDLILKDLGGIPLPAGVPPLPGSDKMIQPAVICVLCCAAIEDNHSLKQHQADVHDFGIDTKYKCGLCNEQFTTEPPYTEHLNVHPLECLFCGKYFYRSHNMQLHLKRHMGIRPYKCESCDKHFLTRQKLQEHNYVHTGEAPLKCNMCNETFKRYSNLIQHRNRHHLMIKKKVKDFICTTCGDVFHSKKKLAWHKEIHENKPKSCVHCSEKFIHLSSLTRHVRRAHNERFVPQEERDRENVECPICKGIYLRSSLETHIKNHSGAKNYTCSVCDKDFTTKWNLKLHKWTHAGRAQKPYKCDLCKGAFVRESDYTAHMNSHKAIRPYTCNYCGAQFIRKYNCQRHVKEHEKVKTFNCNICGKTFHRSYYLNDHMRIHSGIRPFSCHICGKTSTTKSNHNKHVRIHHAREPVSTEN